MSRGIRLTALSCVVAFIAGATASAGTSHTVVQKDKAFAEKKMEIAAGDAVVFKNDDSVKHNILVKNTDFNSGMQEPGQEASYTFAEAGKFKVRCGIHPKMKMTVLVK